MPNIPLKQNEPLAPHTSFGLGGPAEFFAEVHNTDELVHVLQTNDITPIWLLGFGSNTLISDQGLPGLTIVMQGGAIEFSGTQAVVDAGVWWDDFVQQSIAQKLWGVELMSLIPGSVGAALFINITAYGQSIGTHVEWIDVWNITEQRIERIEKEQLKWGYKESIFQKPEMENSVILRACFKLSSQPTESLTYQKAIDVADEYKLDIDNLQDRRRIIAEARDRAGSIWEPNDTGVSRTVGSFFRNPIIDQTQVDAIISYDESGKTKAQIENMNRVHGGDSKRVSAAHVMLAAGFRRGQSWGNVKLNDKNLLKIEVINGASAQEVFAVMQEIVKTCKEKLGIELEPEARILGEFGNV